MGGKVGRGEDRRRSNASGGRRDERGERQGRNRRAAQDVTATIVKVMQEAGSDGTESRSVVRGVEGA